MAVTASVIVSLEAQKIFGVRVVLLNPDLVHESGIFFQLDQSKWKKKDSESFLVTQKFIHKAMKDQVFDFLIDQCIDIVPGDSFYYLKVKEQKVTIVGEKYPMASKECTIT